MAKQTEQLTFSPEEIDTAARAFGECATEMDGYQQEHEALKVASGMFGHFPWVAHKCKEAYEQHHHKCAEAITAAEDSLAGFKSALLATAADYRDTESDHEALSHEMEEEI